MICRMVIYSMFFFWYINCVSYLSEIYLLPSQISKNTDRCHGEKLLLTATLYDALVILSRPYNKKIENQEKYEETRKWLFSNLESPFSFLWICVHLEIDSKKIRREVLYGTFTHKEKRRRIGRKSYKNKVR